MEEMLSMTFYPAILRPRLRRPLRGHPALRRGSACGRFATFLWLQRKFPTTSREKLPWDGNALLPSLNGIPNQIRTGDTTVKGLCANRYTMGT